MAIRQASRHARSGWVRGRRGAVLVGLVAALIAWSPVAATSWGTVYRVSPDYTYSEGNVLGRTVQSDGTAKLHVLYNAWWINGVEATNTGPYLGVYYRRGNSTGSTWGTPKRLNPSTEHGDWGALATSGKYVYAAWRKEPVANGPSSDPRPLQFRRNTNHGSASYWQSRPTFLGADRIDRPAIAATGSTVWIAYTDSVGGEIRLQKSTDNGKTFSYLGAIGATLNMDGGGYSGRAAIAATGNTVAVAYLSDADTQVRISTDGGASWTVSEQLDAMQFHMLDIAASSGRVAVAWTRGDMRRVYLRRWNGTVLGATKTVVALDDSQTYKTANYAAIAMSGTSVIGIAYSACSANPCSITSTSGTSIRWIESRDAGKTWVGHKTIASYSVSASRRSNEVPNVVWGGSSRRIVVWTAAPKAGSPDRLLVRTGTGTP